MSQHIFLVKYESDDIGRFYEEEASIIESAFISTDLLDEITSNWPLVEINILEEKGIDDSFIIETFSNDVIQNVCTFLENLFIRLLQDESKDKKRTDSSSESAVVPSKSELIKKEELNILLERFRTITNLIHLLRLKMDKYASDKSAIIKLG